MQEEQEARRAILNIQEEIRRDLAKEKELQEARNILKQHLPSVNTGCFQQSGLRKGAIVSLLWHF